MDKKTTGHQRGSGTSVIDLNMARKISCNSTVNNEVDNKQLLGKQLEASLKKLVKSVNRLSYTRNPQAMAAANEHCGKVEQILRSYESVLTEPDTASVIDSLLLVETHQMLAEARSLLQAPLEPVVREGNIVELKPSYSDLTDAAFERMLASSDIPQLLSSPLPKHEEESLYEPQQQAHSEQPRIVLRLVYSRDD